MGWFEHQIEERRSADQQLLEDSFAKVAGVVLGQRSAERISDKAILTQNAIDEILKAYHYKPVEVPQSIEDPLQHLDYCLHRYGLMRRQVELEKGWYRDACGPMLGFLKEDAMPVALLPDRLFGYYFTDPATKKRVRVNAKTGARVQTDAFCFYRPLPKKALGISDLISYMKRSLTLRDSAMVVVATLAAALVGLLLPQLTGALAGPVLQSGQSSALIGASIFLLCVLLCSQLLGAVKGLLVKRLVAKTSLGVQASIMMRLLSLPASFYRNYSPGELKSRAMSVSTLCSLLLGVVMSAVLSSVFSLVYLPQIISFTPALALPSLAAIALTAGVSAATMLLQSRINRRQFEHQAKEAGLRYALISSVQKIKLSGAEKRVFAKWLDVYAEGAELVYNPPILLKISNVFTLAISLLCNILLYGLAVKNDVSPASWLAFSAAYGALMGAFTTLSASAPAAANIRPILENADPILSALPESTGGKEIVTSLTGGVELSHVSFRYSPESRFILQNLSLKICPGEYVAIVGKTGCGKSTLVRLLLGFETPEAGAVYYDGKDLRWLDHGSVRKQIGTVMQDEGLFSGNIYSNIVISAPHLGQDAAWEAAEIADIADDIRAFPMGMHTHLSEGQGGISGGQRQRIMIARAVVTKPKLLIFDEATSALDNKAQSKISNALDKMDCTRIVIAHRLSTIRHCSRILVLDEGRIVESGTYEELMAKNGFFAELVKRQMPETGLNL